MNRLYGLNPILLCCISSEKWDESIDVSKIIPIVPFHYHGNWRQRIVYGRILTDRLTKMEIKRLFEEVHAKEIPDIIDKNGYIEFQYVEKPTIMISKKDGKIYCEQKELEKYDMKYIEHQASILVTILNKGRRVDFLTRKNEGRKTTIRFSDTYGA